MDVGSCWTQGGFGGLDVLETCVILLLLVLPRSLRNVAPARSLKCKVHAAIQPLKAFDQLICKNASPLRIAASSQRNLPDVVVKKRERRERKTVLPLSAGMGKR